jgi:hypothetical protein
MVRGAVRGSHLGFKHWEHGQGKHSRRARQGKTRHLQTTAPGSPHVKSTSTQQFCTIRAQRTRCPQGRPRYMQQSQEVTCGCSDIFVTREPSAGTLLHFSMTLRPSCCMHLRYCRASTSPRIGDPYRCQRSGDPQGQPSLDAFSGDRTMHLHA